MSAAAKNWSRRTLAAVAFGFHRNLGVGLRPVESFLLESLSCHQQSNGIVTLNTRLFSSFQAPEPPSSKGQAVYTDIDLAQAGGIDSEPYRRNQDPDAVFVVTGASRGIGLQFVKSLMDRSNVSNSRW